MLGTHSQLPNQPEHWGSSGPFDKQIMESSPPWINHPRIQQYKKDLKEKLFMGPHPLLVRLRGTNPQEGFKKALNKVSCPFHIFDDECHKVYRLQGSKSRDPIHCICSISRAQHNYFKDDKGGKGKFMITKNQMKVWNMRKFIAWMSMISFY